MALFDNVQTALVFGIALVASLTSFAQEASPRKEIIPPTPDAQAFAKYSNVPVSLYTGLPNISVPIYEIKARDIAVPISLSYHASGIKVAEEASRVGLGWVLNAGGLISRTVINGDDFDNGPEGFLSKFRNANWIIAGDTVSMHIPSIDDNNALTPAAVQEGVVASFIQNTNEYRTYNLEEAFENQNVDFEPDQFTYNFLGQSGKFIVRLRMDSSMEVVLERKNKILIIPYDPDPDEDPNGHRGDSWIVKTADGTHYLFDQIETYTQNGTGQTEHTSAWYLSKITSSTGEEVIFDYVREPNEFLKPVGTIFERQQGFEIPACDRPCSALIQDQLPQFAPGKTYSRVRLDSIRWSNGKVVFVHGPREDIFGDIRIDQIQIHSKDPITNLYTLKEVFDFGYDYFTATSMGPRFTHSDSDISEDYLSKRLQLNSLTRKDEDMQNVYQYKFEYYDDDRLPFKNLFGRDHWGYPLSNGLSSLIPKYDYVANVTTIEQAEGLMGSERNATSYPRTAGTLKSIYYPTGGHTEFIYEANTYDLAPTSEDEDPGENWIDHVPFVQAYNDQHTRKPLNLNDEYVDDNNSTVPVTISITFIYKSGMFPEGSGCSPNDIGTFQIFKKDASSPEKTIGVGFGPCADANSVDCLLCNSEDGTITVKSSVVLPPGDYEMIANFNNGFLERISAQIGYTVDGTIRPRYQPDPITRYAFAGGLRIREISDYDPESDPESDRPYNRRTFDYHYRDDDGMVRSYGKLMVRPRYSYYDIAYEKIDIGNGYYQECTKCAYIIRQSDSYLPATGSMGNVVGYTSVTEYHGNIPTIENSNASPNGWTEYEFENEPEIVLTYKYPAETNYKLRPPAISTISNPISGMIKRQTDHSFNGTKKHEILYFPTYGQQRWEYGIEVRRLRTKGFSGIDDPTGGFPNRNPKSYYNLYLYPALWSTFVYNQKTIETFYPGTSTTTEYCYENPAHLQLTKTTVTNSIGRKIATIKKYPADYETPDDVIIEMKERFMPGIAIETMVVDQPDLTQTEDLEDQTEDLEEKILSHDINVFDFFGNSGEYILPKEVIQMNLPKPPLSLPEYNPVVGYNQDYYRKALSMDYNSHGNVELLQKNENVPIGYLWGVRNHFPIAEITNARADEVYVQNFEEVSTSAITIKPHTGRNHYTGDYPVSFTKPIAKDYVLEYWYYENQEWKYKKVDYAGNTTLTDGSAIDDVRIYPKDAMMRTFTYDPFGEMTSVITSSGQTTVYEYDSLSRLVRIRNEKGDIEKQFTYNYKKY